MRFFACVGKAVIVVKEPKEDSVGTPLPGCPTALPSMADTSGEVSLQEYLSLIVVGLPVIIARSEATHPRVASLAPSGQFTFRWPGVAGSEGVGSRDLKIVPFSANSPEIVGTPCAYRLAPSVMKPCFA